MGFTGNTVGCNGHVRDHGMQWGYGGDRMVCVLCLVILVSGGSAAEFPKKREESWS